MASVGRAILQSNSRANHVNETTRFERKLCTASGAMIVPVNFRPRSPARPGRIPYARFNTKFLANFADEDDCTHRRESNGRFELIRWGDRVGWAKSVDFCPIRSKNA